MNLEGTSLSELLFWSFVQAGLIPALLPTLAIIVFGVLILRRMPRKNDSSLSSSQRNE